MSRPKIYGLMAEFNDVSELVSASRKAHDAGYRNLDAYTPYPVEELHDALHLHHNHLPLIVLIGAILGGIGGYALQYWTTVIEYPLNLGGKPFHSWPAFVPVTFECTVLLGALSAVLGMLALNGLPQPYHPVFNVPRFALASRDRFFLCIESSDPKFDFDDTWGFLSRLGPRQVSEVDF